MAMDLQHAILGLLSLQPMSGYDLGRAFAGSVAHFWHADRSQIYRTLARLEERGAIETETISQDGRPDRKLHSPTAAGEAELREWLDSPLEPEQSKEPFLARLFFAEQLGADGVARLLEERRAQAEETLERLSAIEIQGSGLGHELRVATRQNGVQHARAEIAWLDELRDRLDLPTPFHDQEQTP